MKIHRRHNRRHSRPMKNAKSNSGQPHTQNPAGSENLAVEPVDFELSPSWESWVVDNLLEQVPSDELVGTLVASGVHGDLAKREVHRVLNSAAFRRLSGQRKQRLQLQQIVDLQRELASSGPESDAVPRVKSLSEAAFFEHYFQNNTPVVIEGLAKDWPARKRWTLDYLEEILGDEVVEVTAGREADPDYDANFKKHSTDMTLRDFLWKIRDAGTSNDTYMTANNRIMERPAFLRLAEDVTPPVAYVDGDRFSGCTSLWMGPAGTVTPLHHDNTNILFCQVVGRKRFHLASPLETDLLKWATRVYYNRADLEVRDLEQFPELKDAHIKETVLEPGDALFIPVGWWHQVRSLDLSISFSFTSLKRPNRFDWYHPESGAE